jgi:hypothetical protein
MLTNDNGEQEHELEYLTMATRFKTQQFLFPIEIHGAKEGPSTLYGRKDL